MAVAASAHCAVHPAVPAVEVCERCGAFVCGDCLELHEGHPFCASCFQRLGTTSASKQAVAALIFSIVGLNCGFLPGVVGLILAYRERAAIERGQAPIQGSSVTKAALIIGWIDVALLVIGVIALIAFILKAAKNL